MVPTAVDFKAAQIAGVQKPGPRLLLPNLKILQFAGTGVSNFVDVA